MKIVTDDTRLNMLGSGKLNFYFKTRAEASRILFVTFTSLYLFFPHVDTKSAKRELEIRKNCLFHVEYEI